MNYTLHNEAGTRWIIGPNNQVAAHLRGNVNARQAEAIVAALEEHYEPPMPPVKRHHESKFLAAITGGKIK